MRHLLQLRIVNVVATADLKQLVDQDRTGKLPYCKYDPGVYRCVYVSSPKMYSKVSVFRTGKMISVGTKSERQARHDLRFVADYLTEADLIKNRRIHPRLQNIVASVDLEHRIELAQLASKTPHLIYEPEQFPGAMYHPRDPIGVSILFFASGKAVIAGAKDMYELHLAAMELERLAELFEAKLPGLPRQ